MRRRPITAEEANSVDLVVCMPATSRPKFPDNHFGVCSQCGTAIQFRPDVPPKPPKVCLLCAYALAGITEMPSA